MSLDKLGTSRTLGTPRPGDVQSFVILLFPLPPRGDAEGCFRAIRQTAAVVLAVQVTTAERDCKLGLVRYPSVVLDDRGTRKASGICGSRDSH
jgi:hypothetical protein